MNRRMEQLTREIQRNEETLAKLLARQKFIKEELERIENTQIINLVKSYKLSYYDLEKILASAVEKEEVS